MRLQPQTRLRKRQYPQGKARPQHRYSPVKARSEQAVCHLLTNVASLDQGKGKIKARVNTTCGSVKKRASFDAPRLLAVAAQNGALAGWNCEVTSPLRSMLLGLSVRYRRAISARLSFVRSVQITFGAVVNSK